MIRPALLVTALLLPSTLFAADWRQWGGGPSHDGQSAAIGQRLTRNLADIVLDPFAPQIMESGALFAHYPAPLVTENEIYVLTKGGTFTTRDDWETQTWGMRKLQWVSGELVERWTVATGWYPVPFGSANWEPVYHPVISGEFLVAPGPGGTIVQIRRTDGGVHRTINPFGVTPDPSIFVTGPLAAGSDGSIVYSAVRLDLTGQSVWLSDILGAWLVKVFPDGSVTTATYSSLTPVAPLAGDQCADQFASHQLPWPPTPQAVPPTVRCGAQRPGINVAPAIAEDGTIYTVSRAHLTGREAYLVAVNGDLSPKWASSLRNRLGDGCGITIPATGAGSCRPGYITGVDPSDNSLGGGLVNDNGTSSPVITPDGILYGAYTRYNHVQGHLMKFDRNGAFVTSYPFGWDLTPAVWKHDGTYSVILKENRYSTGSYCNASTFCPANRTAVTPSDPEAYYLTQLDSNLHVEWQYRNTTSESCMRNQDGSVSCTGFHPNGFEWCVNAPAVDSGGVVYANAEDGYLYAVEQGGVLRERIFQLVATGAAYTPASIGPDGRIYSQNSGHLFVVGDPGRRRAVRR